jgi:hypothetical protein
MATISCAHCTDGDSIPQPAVAVRVTTTPFGSDVGKPKTLTKNRDALSQRNEISAMPSLNLINSIGNLLSSMFEFATKVFDFRLKFHNSPNAFEIHARINKFSDSSQ